MDGDEQREREPVAHHGAGVKCGMERHALLWEESFGIDAGRISGDPRDILGGGGGGWDFAAREAKSRRSSKPYLFFSWMLN